MRWQVALVTAVQCADLKRSVEAKKQPSVEGEYARHEDGSVLGDCNEPGVEGRVQMGRQEETVEDVEALRVGVAGGPGFDVAGSQELGHGEAGDRATAIPVLEQAAAEDVLTDSLYYQALGFRRPGQVRGLVLEGLEEGVGQGTRELE